MVYENDQLHMLFLEPQYHLLTSIARRGEWSIVHVLDVYWRFGSVGDQYLGRILSGLDPNSDTFDVLPPHWTMNNPMGNNKIKKGIEMTFGEIINYHTHFVPILLRCVACIVFHSTKLIEQMVSVPSHDLNTLRLLHNRVLLNGLYMLVTTEPTTDVMTVPTGISPHIIQSRLMKKILTILLKFITINRQCLKI